MFEQVFVLCTGRSGSVTFARACGHLTNYTAAHESRSMPGPQRMDYPRRHIEADNRLAWMLGRLDERFGHEPLYVHLQRDPEAVARSFDRRWHVPHGLVRAYDRSILRADAGDLAVARDMVATITANIRVFLRDKPHVVDVHLEEVADDFDRFLDVAGAEGDLDAARATWRESDNAGAPPPASAVATYARRLGRMGRGLPALWRSTG